MTNWTLKIRNWKPENGEGDSDENDGCEFACLLVPFLVGEVTDHSFEGCQKEPAKVEMEDDLRIDSLPDDCNGAVEDIEQEIFVVGLKE